MTIYEWICKDCEHFWERDCKFGKAPRKTKCPTCGKLCEQYFSSAPAIHFKGAGWSQKTGYNKIGGSDEIAQKLMDKANKRMETGWQHYARYTPSEGYIKENKLRRMSDSEVKDRIDYSVKTSKQLYDKAKIDPTKINKPQ